MTKRERGFQIMARQMAGEIAPITRIAESIPYERAGGDVVCLKCGIEYVEHPLAPEAEWLRIICGGKRVKL